MEKQDKDNSDAINKTYPPLRKFCLMNSSVVVPLLVFCSHAIRMHDGRSCGVVLRVFRSIVPEFHVTEPAKGTSAEEFPIPEQTAGEIREFISTEVLKAAISSLHDPYFVETQKDLGSLIASILVNYCPLTSTPRDILASLPNIKQDEVDHAIEVASRPGLHSRQQRAVILELLRHLKGVSISEMGKLNKSPGVRPDARTNKKSSRSKMAQEFMTADANASGGVGHAGTVARRQSPALEGVAIMFNEGS